ncbi:MAG: hypothetical protein WCH74_09600 [Chloroflexota bacterium]
MNVTLELGALLHRTGVRRRSGRRMPAPRQPAPAARAALAPVDRDSDACERLLRELAAAALLVERGLAIRVLVCNGPTAIDLDEVRLLADTFDVVVEPIVREGCGGLDFAVRRGIHAAE